MPTIPLARLYGLKLGSLLKAPGSPGPVTLPRGCSAVACVSAVMASSRLLEAVSFVCVADVW